MLDSINKGFSMTCPSIRPVNLGSDAGIFRAPGVLIMHSGKQKGVLLHGCTIKDVINITMNTGWIRVPVRKQGVAE